MSAVVQLEDQTVRNIEGNRQRNDRQRGRQRGAILFCHWIDPLRLPIHCYCNRVRGLGGLASEIVWFRCEFTMEQFALEERRLLLRRNRSCEGRNAQRRSGCDQTSNRDRTGTICARCLALRGQHIFEHRVHRPRATQLCNRATFHAAPSLLIRRPVERLERWRKLLRH